MKTKNLTLCALAASAFLLLGCETEGDKARDKQWIANRAAVLVGKKNPATGKPYTSDEATEAAATENNFARKAAFYSLLQNDTILNKMQTPGSMTAHPSAQPAPMAPSALATPTVTTGHAH